MQPRRNQMKTKIVIRSVANRFKPTAKLAKTVNDVDSGMKHRNVLKTTSSVKFASTFSSLTKRARLTIQRVITHKYPQRSYTKEFVDQSDMFLDSITRILIEELE